MRLPESARQRLANYEGPLVSVEDYLERRQVPIEKSRTISAYKTTPEEFPGASLEDFLLEGVPAELEAIVSWFGLGLKTYIIDRTNKKRNEEFKQPWYVAAYETIADFFHFIGSGEIVVRVEPDQDTIANKYYAASMRELKERMKTVADEFLLDYFRMQKEFPRSEQEKADRVYNIKEIAALYEK